MYFPRQTPLSVILRWVATQYAAIGDVARGYDVELRPHRRKRSNEQNRFLHLILQEMINFFHKTGFLPNGLSSWGMQIDVLRVYWKTRYGVQSTHSLSTAEFTKFIDWIQLTMVEESGGNWEMLTTDSSYIKSLLAQEQNNV